MWYIKKTPKNLKIINQNSNAMGRLPHYELWFREILVTLTIQTINYHYSWLPTRSRCQDPTVKDMHAWVTGHRKMKQGMTWNITVHWLPFLELDSAIQTPEREKQLWTVLLSYIPCMRHYWSARKDMPTSATPIWLLWGNQSSSVNF